MQVLSHPSFVCFAVKTSSLTRANIHENTSYNHLLLFYSWEVLFRRSSPGFLKDIYCSLESGEANPWLITDITITGSILFFSFFFYPSMLLLLLWIIVILKKWSHSHSDAFHMIWQFLSCSQESLCSSKVLFYACQNVVSLAFKKNKTRESGLETYWNYWSR